MARRHAVHTKWQPRSVSDEDNYSTCLADIFAQVADNHPKSVAIPTAAWRCKEHAPPPPPTYYPRCIIERFKLEGLTSSDRRAELHTWQAFVRCFPEYTP